MLEKTLRISELYDLYGALLTEKQRLCLELHYLNDFSLAEIAADMHISRQAVHDLLHRAEQTLESYETKLGLQQRFNSRRQALRQAGDLLRQAAAVAPAECRHIIEQAQTVLQELK